MLNGLFSKTSYNTAINTTAECNPCHKKTFVALIWPLLLLGLITFAQGAYAETYTFPNSWYGSGPTYANNYTDSDGTFTLAWNFNEPPDYSDLSFKLSRKINGTWQSPFTITSYSYSFSNLPTGTYEFHLEVNYWVDDGGNYLESHFVSRYKIVITVPAAPPGTPALDMATTDSDGNYNISWGGLANATSYKWQERVNGGTWSGETTTSSTNTSISGKTSATYGYRIRACNASGCGAYSAERSVIVAVTPGVPTSISASPNPSSGNVTVSWGVASGSVTKYDFDYKKSTTSTWTNGYDGTALSKALTGLAVGTWNYQVRACKTQSTYTSCSGWRSGSSTVMALPSVPYTPFGGNINSTTGDYSTIEWMNYSADPLALENDILQEQVNGGAFTDVSSLSILSIEERDYADYYVTAHYINKPSGVYGYRFKNCNAVGCGYSAVNTVTVVRAPGVPTSLTINPNPAATGSTITVSWGTASGSVSYYDFDYKILSSGSWINAYEGSANNSSFVGSSVGTYYYQVRACCTANSLTSCSGWRTGSSAVMSPPSSLWYTPFNGNISSTTGNYSTIEWMNYYESPLELGNDILQEQVNGGDFADVDSLAILSIEERDYADYYFTAHYINKPSGVYGYRFKNCNAVGCGYSAVNTVTVVRAAGVPTWLSINPNPAASGGNINVSWGEGEGSGPVTHYILAYKLTSASGWTEAYSGTTRATSLSNFAAGSYDIGVKACNIENGYIECSSYQTSTVQVINPPSPVVLEISPYPDIQEGDFDLVWTDIWNNAQYHLYEQVNGGVWADIGGYDHVESESDATYYTTNIRGRADGVYSYHVVSCYQGACNSGSNQITVTVGVEPEGLPVEDHVPAVAVTPEYPDTVPTNIIGTTAGSFRVNESGAATYSIPVATLPGTAGVVPEVALHYSSNAGNGIAGIGWSLSASSMISRCRQTFVSDGASKPITLTSEDRFCLDGQRLVLETGIYGAPDSTYKTEIDSYVTVTAVGGTTGNPDSFEVEAKDGSTSFFGTDDTSKTLVNSVTVSWVRDRYEDSVGNDIVYEFVKEFGVPRISRIKYAYPSLDHTANNPAAAIQFEYESRPDVIRGYDHGEQTTLDKRLSKIQVCADGDCNNVVREYILGYLTEGQRNNSRLAAIQECRDYVCLQATTFTWASEYFGFEDIAHQSDILATGRLFDYKTGDFNGDGNMDLVWMEFEDPDVYDQVFNVRIKYGLSDGEKIITQADLLGESDYINTSKVPSLTVLDYNADGRLDIAVDEKIYLATPDSYDNWKLDPTAISFPGVTGKVLYADFDSDGIVDRLTRNSNNGNFNFLKLNPTQISSATAYEFGADIPVGLPGTHQLLVETYNSGVDEDGNSEVRYESLYYYNTTQFESEIGDFNQDGVVDLLLPVFHFTKTVYSYANLNPQVHDNFVKIGIAAVTLHPVKDSSGNITSVQTQEYAYFADAGSFRVMDLNGDGLSDLFTADSGDWSYRLNNGSDFDDEVTIPDTGVYGDFEKAQIQFADLNSDGYVDLIWHSGGNELLMKRWNGTAYSSTELLLNASGYIAKHVLTDVNGDGRYDYLNLKFDYGYGKLTFTQYMGNGQNMPANVITAIDNGIGNKTEIEYSPLGDNEHYSRLFDAIDTLSTSDFYDKLNSDWSLPIGNDSIGKQQPVLEVMLPMYVVTAVESPAPAADLYTPRQIDEYNKNRIEYHYAEGKIQPGGHGFLGFKHVQANDLQASVQTTTTYRQDWPFIGMPLETTRTSVGYNSSGVLSRSENVMQLVNWNNGNPVAPFQPYIKESIEETYDTSVSATAPAKVVTINSTQDSYGNVTHTLETTIGGGDTFTRETINEYEYSSDPLWGLRMGRLSRSEVKATRNSENGPTRVSTFKYYDSNWKGMLEWEKIQPGTADEVSITHEYDAFGNEIKTTKSAVDVDPRYTTTTFENGRYIKSVANVYGQVGKTVSEWNEYGIPKVVTDINDVVSTSSFNTLGELTRVDISGTGISNWSRVESAFCGSGCPAGALYYTHETSADGSQKIGYFDKIGREIRVSSIGFNGQWTHVDTEYDHLNRVVRVSNPSFTTPNLWTTSEYDLFDRVTKVTSPDGTSVDIDYEGFTTTRTIHYPSDNEGYVSSSKEVTINALGETILVKDALDGEIRNYYTVDGELSKVEAFADNKTKTTRLCYDGLGRKTAMLDPDKGGWDTTVTDCDQVNSGIAGWWHYEYNAYGELSTQTDPKGQQVKNTYDKLGRIIKRLDKKTVSDTTGENVAEWFYHNDASGNAQGQLNYLEATIRTGSQPISYKSDPSYNSIGQLINNVVTIVEGGVTQTHTKTISEYDSLGRTVRGTESATSSDDWSWSGDELRNIYDSYGNVVALVNSDQNDLEYQRTIAVDAYGNVTSQQLADGVIDTQRTYNSVTGMLERIFSTGASNSELQDLRYQWSSRGNLLNRKRFFNFSLQQQEDFTYDALSRLLHAEVVGGDYTTTTYDAFGNLQTKNTYDSSDQLISDASVGTYAYHSGGRNALASTTIGNVTYAYDDNGNIESQVRNGSQDRLIQHTTFDKPYYIEKNLQFSTEFWYGSDRSRIKRRDYNMVSGGITTTWYLGSLEKIVDSNGGIKLKRYIGGVAIETSSYADAADESPQVNTEYLLTDHLGSVQTIADNNGNFVERMSFDVWGQRRDATDWHTLEQLGWLQSQAFQDLKNKTTRGFTGHEMLDEVGLIHMNGRVYDPLLARFMEADPFVQTPGNLQSYNRYAYVWNNPLRATDPSGYLSNSFHRKAFKSARVSLYGFGLITGYGLNRSIDRTFKELAEHPKLAQIVQVVIMAVATVYCGPCSIGVGAGFSAELTYAATGSYEEANKAGAISAITAAAFYGIGQGLQANFSGDFLGSGLSAGGYALKIFAHGMVGGMSAELQGGKFAHGFKSAGFSAAAIPLTGNMDMPEGVIVSALIGGTVSKLSGGKFANGAVTAAFGYIFNQCLSNRCFLAHASEETGRLLPDEGDGYYTYSDEENRYGSYQTIDRLIELGEKWESNNIGYPIGIGDISTEFYGPTPGHSSHMFGVDIDIRPFRLDGARAPLDISTNPELYDADRTASLVRLLLQDPNVVTIFFNDTNMPSVTPLAGHSNHMHVRYRF
jgi:RHS repeat-associated protein